MNYIYTLFPVLCLCIGFYFGYKLGDTKKLPEVNPVKVADNVKTEINSIKKKKEQNKKINRLNEVLHNLDTFDGSSKGQKPIKK